MTTERLFSYGTLQLEAVQLATFGRLLTGTPDGLPAFELGSLEIEDQATVALSGKRHHSIARFTGRASDVVPGTVYEITGPELERADQYEVAAYQRVAVRLRSGTLAWAYVDAAQTPPRA